MDLDQEVSEMLAVGPFTVERVVVADDDPPWVAIKLGDGRRVGGRRFTEAVEVVFKLKEHEAATER
jgi:hypothetical protein